tara:strand:+ start:232 stop:477 length:246 start_codon:yes stop_codon:yes gene_type:complete
MDNRYIIIGRSSCPFCAMAEDFLNSKKIENIFLDYENDRKILEDYKTFHKQPTVPIVLANSLSSGYTFKVGGYSDLLEHFK